MPESAETAWDCPSCGRHVPMGVDRCRCGLVREEALARRRALDETPAAASRPASRAEAVAHALVGYHSGLAVPPSWRRTLAVSFVAALALVFGSAEAWLSQVEAPRTSSDVTVLARLDDFTRHAAAGRANTIPAFVAQPGLLGILKDEPVGRPGGAGVVAAVEDLEPTELRKGFCTSNLALLVRQEYPGSYDSWSDADLERKVLAAHPEYRDKLCVLPAWIDATPREVVKYELAFPPLTLNRRAWLWSILATAAFGLGGLNLYYRVVGRRFARPLERAADRV